MTSSARLPLLAILLLLWLAACTYAPPRPPPTLPPALPPPTEPIPALTPVEWSAVDGWLLDQPSEALGAFLQGCRALGKRPQWQSVCNEGRALDITSPATVRAFFEQRFTPHQVRNPDGSDTGVITGYFVPELKGSRTRTERFRYPLYAVPDDLLIIDLRSVYPELANYRLRGRLVGRKVLPYYSRGELTEKPELLADKVLFWVDDPVELFFLQVQGSGRILLDDGTRVMIHYAEANGHPFRSIGKLLLDGKEMTRDQMSIKNLRAWARKNPERTAALLNENPSYIFFEPLPGNPESPPGALGVSLTPGRSLAIDPKTIPLGAPVFLSATGPGKNEPLQRLMLAQDTGGAIRGAVRADFFWGMGDEAGTLAGRMKNPGKLWVLLPNKPSEAQETD